MCAFSLFWFIGSWVSGEGLIPVPPTPTRMDYSYCFKMDEKVKMALLNVESPIFKLVSMII